MTFAYLGHIELNKECNSCTLNIYSNNGKTHVIWKNNPTLATNANT
jgi:hypothetical protein